MAVDVAHCRIHMPRARRPARGFYKQMCRPGFGGGARRGEVHSAARTRVLPLPPRARVGHLTSGR